MPEIWLRYGTTDISLDIRFENLYKDLTPAQAPNNEADEKLQRIPLEENSLFIVLSSSELTKHVLSSIIDLATTKDIERINIMTLPKLKDYIYIENDRCRYSVLSANNLLALGEIMNKFQKIFFLSHTAYDPLFGFEGTPTHLLRNLNKVKMSDAIKLLSDDLPRPGIMSEPYSLALAECSGLDATSIEIVGNSNILLDVYVGAIEESFRKASSRLIENCIMEPHPIKSEIVCPGYDPILQFTLTDSLNCLWNSTNILSEDSSAILLSEGRGGLGSKAIEMFVQGRFNSPSAAEREGYVDGQEHLMFLEATRKRCDIGVVSTIPKYYLRTKLGLDTFDSLSQVMEKLLSKHGKNHKLALISDARTTLSRLDPSLKKG